MQESIHPISGVMQTALENIKDMIDVNTVVGEPMVTGSGSTVIPVSKVSFGFVAGGGEYNLPQPDAKMCIRDRYTLYGYMDGMGLDNRDLVIAVTTFSQNEENVIAFLNELIQSGRGDMPERLKQ